MIYLYRHGLTTYNAEKRYQGKSDIPLSPEGERALRRAPFDVEEVYVSPLSRARQTAEILFPTARQIEVEGFQEMDFGIFEGRNYIEMEHDAAYRTWVDGGCEGQCPGGESRASFCARVCAAFESLVEREAQGNKPLVIVAHGGTLRAVMERYTLPERDYFAWNAPCGGGYSLSWNPEIWHNVKKIHLSEVIPC